MENIITILEFLAAIVAGVATSIPLIIKLIKYVEEVRRSRNWGKLLGAVLNLMEDAEELISKGADKKAWVMAGVANLADEIDYDIDEAQLSELIDQLCEMSKKINVLGDDAE